MLLESLLGITVVLGPTIFLLDFFCSNSPMNYRESKTDSEYDSSVKLTFDQFASFFSINPHRYKINNDWYAIAYCDEDREMGWRVCEKTLPNGEKYITLTDAPTSQIVYQREQRIYFKNYFQALKYNRFRRRVEKELEQRREMDRRNAEMESFAQVVQKDINRIQELAGREREQALDEMMSQLEMMKGK